MELTQKMDRTPSVVTWVVSTLAAVALGLAGGWYLHPNAAAAQPTAAPAPSAASLEPPRVGGPGGQVGDIDTGSRVGGPGGQLGDVP